jgi:hypothetical protein
MAWQLSGQDGAAGAAAPSTVTAAFALPVPSTIAKDTAKTVAESATPRR